VIEKKTVKGQKKFWLQKAFLTCSWRFFKYDELEQLYFKLEKCIGLLETYRKN
jgi:hypothetical protein